MQCSTSTEIGRGPRYAARMSDAITWPEFARSRPDLAEIGHEMFYEFDVGLGFLATVRGDGGPRVHPVCPIFHEGRLFVSIIPGPKLDDLRRDSRYALHSETFPPPREDDGFYVTGRVIEVADGSTVDALGAQMLAERGLTDKWPNFDDMVFFELTIERALLTLTSERDGFAGGATSWRPSAD
jgi:hypothetical protein